MLLLTLLLAGGITPNCRTIPSGVQCELKPPVPHSQVVTPSVARPSKPKIVAEAHDRPVARRFVRVVPATPANQMIAVDDATAQLHVASLVSIGDCTGARTYAQLIGKTALSNDAYSDCVGGPTTASSDVASSR